MQTIQALLRKAAVSVRKTESAQASIMRSDVLLRKKLQGDDEIGGNEHNLFLSTFPLSRSCRHDSAAI